MSDTVRPVSFRVLCVIMMGKNKLRQRHDRCGRSRIDTVDMWEGNKMKQYIVDAFTEKVFAGNPAAVCIMDEWLPEDVMLDITRENNLSETAFAVKEGDHYHLRWFTPGGEIDLCGHATLATSYVIFRFIEPELEEVHFETLSGRLIVTKKGEIYELDFPAYRLNKVEVTQEMLDAVGVDIVEAYLDRDLLCVLKSEEDVRNFAPDFDKIKNLKDGLLLNITAPGSECDCVSRSFAPKLDVNEDPVCGSAHCHIIPYWATRLGKEEIVACQASRRGGTLYCRSKGDRVVLGGKAALFSIAEIFLD